LRERPERTIPSLVRAIAFVVACGASAGCGGPDLQKDRPLEVLVAFDAETLDPRHASDAPSLRVSRLVHAGLVRLDPDTLLPQPYVAASWKWEDARTLRVELRPGLRFHSGKPVTSADVVATIAAFKSKDVGSRHARVVEAVQSTQVDGPHAVVIKLKRAHATLVTDLELPILRADEAASPPRPDGNLDGLGPYRVTRRERGVITLTPADGGALPKPAHGVVVRTVRDENARALRLHAGRADVAVNVLSPTLLPAMDGHPGLTMTARTGANLSYLLLRADRPPLADVKLRRAISLAIDRDGIAKTLFAGRAHPATTLLPEGSWAQPALAPHVFDASEARRIVGEGSHGRPRISLLTSTERLRRSIANTIAQELADAGIDVEVTPLEFATFLARLTAGDFQMASLLLPELGEPNTLRTFLHSAAIPPAGSNRGRVRDAELDKLLDQGDAETNLEARKKIYESFENRMRDMLYVIPLWHEDQVSVTSDRAKSFVPSAEGRWLSLAAVP
jgi:peptide/nickel transport system substrate-binding protein